jgi:hypothetical protein
MLEKLARYDPNYYFIFGPGTWREREDREVGFTVQEENDHLLLYHDGNPRLLNFKIKEWSLDKKPWDASIQGRWHPAFHLDMGALRPPICSMVSEGARDVSWVVPLFDTLCGSVPPVCMYWEWSPSSGELPEHRDKVMIFFLSLSLFLVKS